jgi:hypothetical protein
MGATLLDDGRIYLTGGLSNSSWAGIYDRCPHGPDLPVEVDIVPVQRRFDRARPRSA